MLNRLIMGSSIFALVIATPVWATSDEMAMEDVPEVVMEAAENALPDATFEKAGMEEGVYELMGKDSEGMVVEIDILEDGTVEEIESIVSIEEVPDAVMDKLNEAFSDFEIEEIEKSVRPDEEGEVVWYEFEGKTADDSVDVEITEDASKMVIDED